MVQTHFISLPLGAVKPAGWLKDQLTIQANGLTGHLDEFWESVSNSAWKGGSGDSWERGPYYLDGLVPLAYLLDDERLLGKVKTWIEPILASGRPDGWFGPAQNQDRWPLAVALKVLTQYYEASQDERAMTIIQNYIDYLNETPPNWPDREWRGVRAMENMATAYWLYRRTGDEDALKAAETIYTSCFDWTHHFNYFPFDDEWTRRPAGYGHPCHVVNLGMAVKYPGLIYELSGEERHRLGSYSAIQNLDKYHGQAAGRYSGDEHLSGRHPSQGTELCGVVEFMFSLENLVEIFGDSLFADRLEVVAYNAKPGTCTPDYWAHQYDQQSNQVLCTVDKRQWSTNGDFSNLYGLEPNYGCCTANMHQGWPKFVSHMWMATQDNGLAAVAYGPCAVTAIVGGGRQVEIVEETDYPFDGTIRLTVNTESPVSFPLHIRIPAWAEGASIQVGARIESPQQTGEFVVIYRNWAPGDQAIIELPMNLRTETRFNDAASILRGPLYFSLKIGEYFKPLRRYHDSLPVVDYAVFPTTHWNYALQIDREHPERDVKVMTTEISETPFSHDDAPVVLKVKGRMLPKWTMKNNSADAPPQSPVVSEQPLTDLKLIPYGSTRLRITEFPVLAE
ncbi:MAG: glycoside hydrolase family 127 protein [Candidatus Omnitrophica bacterium]|nr:glycoside hydrolase family 127 protein [Candidatus Omnitrophota bacterium]